MAMVDHRNGLEGRRISLSVICYIKVSGFGQPAGSMVMTYITSTIMLTVFSLVYGEKVRGHLQSYVERSV